jgi:glycerol dehydrogenase
MMESMRKILASPARYVQGKGELANIAEFSKPLGTKAFILISANGVKRNGGDIEMSFAEKNISFIFVEFGGESSRQEIEKLRKEYSVAECDFVVGVGGGKIIDTAKAVAYYESAPCVICPTIAATDAPCSALTVLYTPEGIFEEYLFLPKNPDVVLVDTEIIIKSPTRLTVSGMGDALATYFEAKSSVAKDANNFVGGKAPEAAIAIAKLSYDILLSHGKSAVEALNVGAITQAVEKVIEANTLLSGIGFESCGVAAAHSIHNGLTALEETHDCYHGEKVAFGVLTLLVLEDYPKCEMEEVYRFCLSVGLPVTLEELGIVDVTRERLMKVAELACAEGETIANTSVAVTPEDALDAMLAADALGRMYKAQ